MGTPSQPAAGGADPRAQYAGRLETARARRDGYARQDARVSNGRLAAFAAAAVLAWLAVIAEALSPWWVVLPAAAFGALVVAHQAVLDRRARAESAVRHYEAGLRRLEGTWAGTGVPGTRFADAAHPYAVDLDLFGRGSLFERLCTAHTRVGEETLAAWLLAPAPPDTVRARQAAVEELRGRLDLREDLSWLAADVRSGTDLETLSRWGEQPARLAGPGIRVVGGLLAAGAVAGGAVWAAGLGSWPFWVVVGLQVVYSTAVRRRVARTLRGIDRPARDLAALAGLLGRLESEQPECALLRSIQDRLGGGGQPSKRIARLQGLVGLLEMRRSLLAPLVGLLLLPEQVAYAVETWRAESGPRLRDWCHAIGEYEALAALSGYGFEQPEDVYPTIAEGEARFEAAGMAHPLLPAAEAVRNDVTLDASTRLLIVSGSNMSGKSTLLRAVGTNAVLALAGAPVRAHHLALSPVSVGASIRTVDSLQAGVSRFYAEITRLRALVTIAVEHPPLLYLLDEILHGTNSHDRRIGAAAVARSLLERGAIGLMTTHDLALARIADEAGAAAANVHFQDEMLDGRMVFDYTLRPGMVTKSNAIALMRAVGLEV